MRWGLVARSEDRGLGIISWEVQRNLAPDRTLLVDMGELARGFEPHPERFPGAWPITFHAGTLDEAVCREWLAGLDVVLMLETAYDWAFIRWAREERVATVLLAMPEFYLADHPAPDVIWNPTTWRHTSLPDAARVVPVPVATDRFTPSERRREGPIRVLHNAGHRAAMDRNGTSLFLAALRHVIAGPVEVTVSGQDGRLPSAHAARGMTIRNHLRGQVDYWDVPTDADLLVMPRRYGGLCLPVQEALAAGATPVLPDCPPNGTWPARLVPCVARGEINTPSGPVPLHGCDPRDIATAISYLAGDELALDHHRRSALAWAREHSWEALGPLWLAELARAAEIAAHAT